MVELSFDPELRDRCPRFRVGLLACRVRNRPTSEALWTVIDEASRRFQNSLTVDAVNKHPAIAATREAYKCCGKDPNRYRPSAEALRRRVVQGKGLYRVSTLVDVVNLLSLESGFSIGAFDLDAVEGALQWGIGRAGEPYAGIGRGELNIEGLPVVRDAQGAIGTPTSDSDRTKLTADTTRLLLNINDFGGDGALEEALDRAVELYAAYGEAADMDHAICRT